jgi:acetolactate synthase-1/2/3 large subunit
LESEVKKIQKIHIMDRLSDYVIDFIAKQGVKHIFMVSGGGGMFLIDSLGRRKDIDYVCNHHEQASTIAAESYQRVSENLGVSLVTTGPASTNAVTGVLCAWNDSLPLLVLSGQANSNFLIGDTGLRQRGNHEVNITKIVESVTKYAVIIKDEKQIRYHLEKAIYLARNGRPGPVWIDVPLDIQGKMIDIDSLEGFDPAKEFDEKTRDITPSVIETTKSWLKAAKRPIFLAGNGIRLSKSVNDFLHLANKLNIPIVITKNFYDVLPEDFSLLMGMSGTYGKRSANLSIQNSDLVIVLGSRLCFSTVGYATQNFAREAKKIVVDIDDKQLTYSHIKIDLAINGNVNSFIKDLDKSIGDDFNIDYSDWLKKCQHWKMKYPVVTDDIKKENKYINSNFFFEVLSEELGNKDILVCDQGSTFYSFTVAFKVKQGQRAFTNGGFSALGYGLPASIGACFANDKKRVICVSGDGGLQFNIQELQTIVHHNLPIKLFVFNNEGYGSIKNTQMNYFNGFFVGSDPSSGLTCPDTARVANAYGIKYLKAKNHATLRKAIRKSLELEGPVIIEIFADPMQLITPRVASERKPDGRMVSKPLEDMFPLLDRNEFYSEMIIKPLDE